LGIFNVENFSYIFPKSSHIFPKGMVNNFRIWVKIASGVQYYWYTGIFGYFFNILRYDDWIPVFVDINLHLIMSWCKVDLHAELKTEFEFKSIFYLSKTR